MLGTPKNRQPPLEAPVNPLLDKAHVWLGGLKQTNYRTPGQTRRIKAYCLHRDGYKCMYCLLPAQEYELQVHHVRDAQGRTNIQNQWSDWVQLFHPDCNVDERWGRSARRLAPAINYPQLSTPSPKKETAELLLPETRQLRDDDRSSPGLILNIDHEPEFRRACFVATLKMADPGFKDLEKYMNKRQMMAYAMELSGASRDAAYGYISKLFAMQIGPLIEVPELGGKMKTVKFRNAGDYKLDDEKLMAKYPKEGQAYSH